MPHDQTRHLLGLPAPHGRMKRCLRPPSPANCKSVTFQRAGTAAIHRMLLRVDGGRSRRPGRGRGGGRSGGGGWGGGRRLVSADIGVDDEMAHGWLMSLRCHSQ
eukprot:766991-Hanusia_phi.AAC.15